MSRPPAGLVALSGFFAFGAVVAGVSCVALLTPGSAWEPMWRLNPEASVAFGGMGVWAVAMMFTVAAACALSAWGLWTRARWGHRLALILLVVYLVRDATNTLIRGDLRTLIDLPIGGALIAYLLSAGVRRQFVVR